MNSEIETIINDLGNYASNEKPQRNEHNVIIPYSLHYTDANLLFSYICELEEENKKLKEEKNETIECIEKNKQITMFADLRKDGTHQYTIECDADDLLGL